MSRSDVKGFGELIDAGQACLVVVGQSTIQAAFDKAELKAELKAERHAQKQLDVSSKDIDDAIQETAKQLG